jgi:hypothetical protein
MKTTFYIVLNMKTARGFESFGRFFIGNDRDFAGSLFSSLKGSDQVKEEDILHLDLMETKEGLPVNMKVINCTLDELSVNCRIITKEVFRLMNLENMGS